MILLAIYLLLAYIFPLVSRILAYLPVVFLPFIFAIVLALIIEPLVEWFEKRLRIKRTWAVLISLLLALGGVSTMLIAIVSVAIREMTALYRLAISHSDEIIGRTMTSLSDFRVFYLQLNLPPQLQTTLQDNLQSILLSLQHLMNNSINLLMQGFIKLPGIMIFSAIATVATFLIIKDRALIRTFVIDFLPARSQLRNVITELLKTFSGFIKAYSILMTITAILTLVGLKILGVEYALLIGLLVGICDILPIIGPGAVLVPWIIWEFISHNTSMGLSLLVLYVIISLVRQFLEPQIVGDSIGLHPLATLISMYVGLQAGGVPGMFLGPIIVVIFIASYRVGLLDRFDWREKA